MYRAKQENPGTGEPFKSVYALQGSPVLGFSKNNANYTMRP